MAVKYRKYTHSDRPVIEGLAVKLLEWVAKTNPLRLPKTPIGFAEHFLDEIEGKLATGNSQVLVAEVDGKIAGYIYGSVLEQSEEDLLELIEQKVGLIEDIYVEQEIRSQGIGNELIKRMERVLKNLGCSCVILYTDQNSPAHEFYKKRDYRDIRVRMYKELS